MILLTQCQVARQAAAQVPAILNNNSSSIPNENQNQLTTTATNPWLGISMINLSNVTGRVADLFPGLTESRGALVADVQPGSPAEKAGIQHYDELSTTNGIETESLGDIILAVDNKYITKATDAIAQISQKKIGDVVNLTLLRNDQIKQVSVTLLRKPADLTYENPTYGVSMQYPSSWHRSERGLPFAGEDIVGFNSPPPNSGAGLFVSVNNYLGNITLNEFTNATINYMKTDPNFRVLQSNTTALADGRPAHRLLYTFTNCAAISPTCPYKNEIMRIWTVVGNKAYTIRYAAQREAFGSYLPIVQKMINSFKINSAIVSQAGNLNNTKKFVTYESSPFGIKIQYPLGWLISHYNKQGIPGIGFYAPFLNASDNTFTVVGISIQPAQHMALEAITNESIKDLGQQQGVSDLNIIQSTATTLAGSPAHKILYTATDSNVGKVKDMTIWTIKNNTVYQITYSSEPSRFLDNLSTAQRMIDSFEIMNSTR